MLPAKVNGTNIRSCSLERERVRYVFSWHGEKAMALGEGAWVG